MSYTFMALAGIVSLAAIIVYWIVELRYAGSRRNPIDLSDTTEDGVLAAKIVPTTSGSGVMLVDLERRTDDDGVTRYVLTGTVDPGGYVFKPYTLRDPVDVMVRWMEVTGDVLDYELFEAESGGEAMS